MASKFKPGEIVRLKSGGPPMTVLLDSDGRQPGVQAVWFAGARREQAWFSDDALETTEAPAKK